MSAYPHEYEFIKSEGVEFRFLARPLKVVTEGGRVNGLECVRAESASAVAANGATAKTIPVDVEGSEFVLPADLIIKAIGQNRPGLVSRLGLVTELGFIAVNGDMETNLSGVYAGGDCVRARGSASTVMAVQDGKLAASAIHRRLSTHG